MKALVDYAIPALIILSMTAVGLELTVADLQRVLRYPLHVGVGLVAQFVLLPLVAVAMIVVLRPSPAIAGGLILAVSAPQATSSNYYCFVAGADIALSVTLTAASSVLALVATPLIARLLFDAYLGQQGAFTLPALKVMQQVVTGLLLPVAAGMLVRHFAPRFTERNKGRFRAISMTALIAMLVVIVVAQAASIWRDLAAIAIVAVLFTLIAAALGMALGRVLRWNWPDTVTLLAAFPARSLSIATLIAVNVLGRLDFLAFAVVFFVVQALIMLPTMMLIRQYGGSAHPAMRG